MEQSQLQEILNALSLFSEDINKKIDQLENKMDDKINRLENKMDERFDRLDKKVDGLRVELIETQETVDYLASKSLQHERKIRTFTNHTS